MTVRRVLPTLPPVAHFIIPRFPQVRIILLDEIYQVPTRPPWLRGDGARTRPLEHTFYSSVTHPHPTACLQTTSSRLTCPFDAT